MPVHRSARPPWRQPWTQSKFLMHCTDNRSCCVPRKQRDLLIHGCGEVCDNKATTRKPATRFLSQSAGVAAVARALRWAKLFRGDRADEFHDPTDVHRPLWLGSSGRRVLRSKALCLHRRSGCSTESRTQKRDITVPEHSLTDLANPLKRRWRPSSVASLWSSKVGQANRIRTLNLSNPASRLKVTRVLDWRYRKPARQGWTPSSSREFRFHFICCAASFDR